MIENYKRQKNSTGKPASTPALSEMPQTTMDKHQLRYQLQTISYWHNRAETMDSKPGQICREVVMMILNSSRKIGTNIHSNDINRLRSYMIQIQEICKEERTPYTSDKLAAYLMAEYAPSTALQYMIQIQTHVEPALKIDITWKNCLKLAQIRNAHAVMESAQPATVEQIKVLIGNLSTPVQRAIYQQYVLVGRFSESQLPYDDDGSPNINTWYLTCFPQFKTIRFEFRTHKGSPTGFRPYSKWITYKNQQHLQLFHHHGASYTQVLSYIKNKFPELSTYSLRYAAIQQLQSWNYQPEEIALLSGHSRRDKIPSLHKVYLATIPTDNDAILASKMSSRLSDNILPNNFW